jgi:type IV pilus assembly protein PilN
MASGRWIGWQGLLSAALALVLVAGLWLSYHRTLAREAEKLRFLRAEVAKLDEQVGDVRRLKDVIREFLARAAIVEALRAERYAAALLEELARARPKGVYLVALRDDRRRFAVTGFAASDAEAAAFLAAVGGSAIFKDARLLELRVEPAPPRPAYPVRFTLGVALKGVR